MVTHTSSAPAHRSSRFGGRAIVVGWLLLFLALVVAATAVFLHYSRGIEQRAQSDLQTITVTAKQQIEGYVAERFRDARLLAQRAPVWQAVDQSAGPVVVSDLQERLGQALAQTRQAYGYRSITLFDRTLQYRAGTDAAEPLQAAETIALRLALSTGRGALVDMHVEPHCQPCFGVAEPVFAGGDTTKSLVGVLYLELDAPSMLYPRVLAWPGLAQRRPPSPTWCAWMAMKWFS